jgi:hypothetical protein
VTRGLGAAAVGALLVLPLAGCAAGVSLSSSASPAERAYSETVRKDMSVIAEASAGLHPVCDKGGRVQGCYEASTQVIVAVKALTTSLASTSPPARFATADAHLREGLNTDLQGLTIRNQGLAKHDNQDWVNGQAMMSSGMREVAAALSEYPAVANLA